MDLIKESIRNLIEESTWRSQLKQKTSMNTTKPRSTQLFAEMKPASQKLVGGGFYQGKHEYQASFSGWHFKAGEVPDGRPNFVQANQILMQKSPTSPQKSRFLRCKSFSSFNACIRDVYSKFRRCAQCGSYITHDNNWKRHWKR